MDWEENNACIRCDKGGNVLVCSENGCPLAVHEGCLGYPANLDDAGRFRCPYCLYKQAVVETRKAREYALARKKALLIFMDGSERGVGENGRDLPISNGTNVNVTSKSKPNDGVIDQGVRLSEPEKIRNASGSSAGSKAEDPLVMMNGEKGSRAAEEKRVQEEEREKGSRAAEEKRAQEEEREKGSRAAEEKRVQEAEREVSVEEQIQEEQCEASLEEEEDEEEIQEEQREVSVEEEEEEEEIREEEREASVKEVEILSKKKKRLTKASVEEVEILSKKKKRLTRQNMKLLQEEEEEEEIQEEQREASIGEEEETHEEKREASVEEEEEETHEEKHESSAEEEDNKEDESEASYVSNSQDSSFTLRAKRGLKRSKPVEKEPESARVQSKSLKHNDKKTKPAPPAVSTPTRKSARGSSSAKGTGKPLKKELVAPKKLARPILTSSLKPAKRQRLMWTAEEEIALREGVTRYSREEKIPWRKILEESNKFNETRTPEDLRHKWKKRNY